MPISPTQRQRLMQEQPACTRCRSTEPRYGWQQRRDGGWHIRVECGGCGGYLKFAPQCEPFLTLANRTASETAVLDVLVQSDELGIGLHSDGRTVSFATHEDYRQAHGTVARVVASMLTYPGLLDGETAMPVARRYGFHPRVIANPASLGLTTVYAIWDGEAVKIGKCKGHPATRLKELQTGNSRTLQLLAWTTNLTERQAHSALWSVRVRGEWFRLSEKLLDEIRGWDWLAPDLAAQLRQRMPEAASD